jgi:hypothetical protein
LLSWLRVSPCDGDLADLRDFVPRFPLLGPSQGVVAR